MKTEQKDAKLKTNRAYKTNGVNNSNYNYKVAK